MHVSKHDTVFFFSLCVYVGAVGGETVLQKSNEGNWKKNVFSWTKWALGVLVCFHFLEWNLEKPRPNGSRHSVEKLGNRSTNCTNTANKGATLVLEKKNGWSYISHHRHSWKQICLFSVFPVPSSLPLSLSFCLSRSLLTCPPTWQNHMWHWLPQSQPVSWARAETEEVKMTAAHLLTLPQRRPVTSVQIKVSHLAHV